MLPKGNFVNIPELCFCPLIELMFDQEVNNNNNNNNNKDHLDFYQFMKIINVLSCKIPNLIKLKCNNSNNNNYYYHYCYYYFIDLFDLLAEEKADFITFENFKKFQKIILTNFSVNCNSEMIDLMWVSLLLLQYYYYYYYYYYYFYYHYLLSRL